MDVILLLFDSCRILNGGSNGYVNLEEVGVHAEMETFTGLGRHQNAMIF